MRIEQTKYFVQDETGIVASSKKAIVEYIQDYCDMNYPCTLKDWAKHNKSLAPKPFATSHEQKVAKSKGYVQMADLDVCIIHSNPERISIA